jgi:hypothetical protein
MKSVEASASPHLYTGFDITGIRMTLGDMVHQRVLYATVSCVYVEHFFRVDARMRRNKEKVGGFAQETDLVSIHRI